MKTMSAKACAFLVLSVLAIVAKVHAQDSFKTASAEITDASFMLGGTEEGVITDLATINFTVFKDGTASMTVSDEKGNLVAQLIDGEIVEGRYTMYFKPEEEIKPGEYFLNMEMNGEKKSERFIVSRDKK